MGRRSGAGVLAAAGVMGVVACAAGAWAGPAEQEITFEGHGGFELSGTLLIPEGEEGTEWPAVLLLPGSGPTDRDGNQLPALRTDLLKQLAEGLAEAGIASLRFDKRAAARYRERWPRTPEEANAFFGWEEFAGDAAAAYRWVRDREEIADDRVAIAGHSEGGLIALQIAHDPGGGAEGGEARPAALVLLSTAGRTMDEVLRDQVRAGLGRSGAGEAERRTAMEALDRAIAAVKAGEPVPADLPRSIARIFNPAALDLLRAYFTIDPAELAKAYPGPVLIVQGARDVQVSAEHDAPRLEGALRERAEGTVDVRIVEGASHNLKDVGPGPVEMPGFEGPVKPEAMEAVVGWLKERLAAPPGGAEEAAEPEIAPDAVEASD